MKENNTKNNEESQFDTTLQEITNDRDLKSHVSHQNKMVHFTQWNLGKRTGSGCYTRRFLRKRLKDGTVVIEEGQVDPDEKYPPGEYPEGWDEFDEAAEREYIAASESKLKNWRFYIRKEWWYWYIIIVVICVLVGLMSIYDRQIISWLTPAATWLKDLQAGWIIPIVVLFVVSFPPLFGHEIISVLCGLVWGLGMGLGIVAAGTFLGEIGNFYAFRYAPQMYKFCKPCVSCCHRIFCCCRPLKRKVKEGLKEEKDEPLEEQSLTRPALEHVCHTGGFFVVLMVRLSAIPSHFSTAVFASCGMSIWTFILAAILSLPKQLVIVYVGVVLASSNGSSTKNKIISDSVLGVGCVLTIFSMVFVAHKMNAARIHVWRERHKAERQMTERKSGKE